jgi:hypothetical protein
VIIELGANVVAVNTCEASVDVETVCTNPFVPTNAYPCPVPMFSCVVDAYVNEASVVVVLANVCSAVHELALPRFRDSVELLPPSRAPRVPVTVSDEFVASDVVATV